MKPHEGRSRVIIEQVEPEIDCGRHAAKRVIGDTVRVVASIYGDGHDHLGARLRYRRADERTWRHNDFQPLGNDIWEAFFTVDAIGGWVYTIQAWVDHFDTWVHDIHKRLEAQDAEVAAMSLGSPQTGASALQTGAAASQTDDAAQQAAVLNEPVPGSAVLNTAGSPLAPAASSPMAPAPASLAAASTAASDVALAFRSGAILLDKASTVARDADARTLKGAASSLRWLADKKEPRYDFPLSEDLIALALQYPDLSFAATYSRELPLWVDRERARFSSWYEFFPRSAAVTPGTHGTLKDVTMRIPEVSAMGFDVLYLPPIHPIGTAFRKGKNNSTTAEPGDVGSPWAIGNVDGGHKGIAKELGNFSDFAALVKTANASGIDLALDIAFQCSPDHPWVKQHPEWFQIRPDGSIQYAENPPKKYQDIYPLNFESSDWASLWQELFSVFAFWIDKGVRVFRVDNPHTKALPFWEWCIAEVRKTHPEVIFLAEAFTRPHVMYGLAKGGYTQSYTYFSWRTEKAELTEYMKEVTTPPVSEFFRPNLWPNTPDILPGFLQTTNPAAFMQRVILAATLGASYGVYGPAFELMEHLPAKPGSEEYLHSEKYQLRDWKRDDPKSLAPLLTLLNTIRHQHPALQTNETLRFHTIDNRQLICYSKRAGDDVILCVVNLDTDNVQTGFTDLDLAALGLGDGAFTADDLLSGESYSWSGVRNYVALDPGKMPAHVLHVKAS